MDGIRRISGNASVDPAAWRVTDDLQPLQPAGQAELDVIESFLMPVIRDILSGRVPIVADRTPMPGAAVVATHKRRKAAG